MERMAQRGNIEMSQAFYMEVWNGYERSKELEEENKNLKSDLAFERTMLDNVRAEYKSLQNVIKNLKAELSKYKKQYQHSMGFMEEDTLQELRDIGEL